MDEKSANGGLRLERMRKPFEGSKDDLEPWELKQLASVVGDEDRLGEMFGGEDEEYAQWFVVDVVDAKTDDVKYQMHLFGYGDGAMFANETTKVVANFCQHGYDPVESLPKATVQALANAWRKDAKRLKLWEGHIHWRDGDEGDGDDE